MYIYMIYDVYIYWIVQHNIDLQQQLSRHFIGFFGHLPSEGGLIAHDVAARQPAQVTEPHGMVD